MPKMERVQDRDTCEAADREREQERERERER